MITELKINFDNIRRMLSAAEDLWLAGEQDASKNTLIKLSDKIKDQIQVEKC